MLNQLKEDSQMKSRIKLSTIKSTTYRAIVQRLTNGLVGLFLIWLGLYHNLADGRLISQWLRVLDPPLNSSDINMGQLGFEMGGYLTWQSG